MSEFTAAVEAIQRGDVAALERLLAAGAIALAQAVINDRPDTTRVALEHGARTDIRDKIHGGTPLGWVRYVARPRAAAYLESLA